MNLLSKLLEIYKNVPEIYKATTYWQQYDAQIADEIMTANIQELRSGKYPIFATFGYNEHIYHYRHNTPYFKKWKRKLIRKLFITGRRNLPYNLGLKDIREMAFRHADIIVRYSGAKSIKDIEADYFGRPQDLFTIDGNVYIMKFLTFYIRHCLLTRSVNFKGDEILVELGSGSGHQVEVLKKLYPDLTILCFDLPAPLYLCEEYLSNVLGRDSIVSAEETLSYKDLSYIKKGKVHMLPNWLFPLLKDFEFDIFWNAASFGEMEPHVVQNYLSFILTNCKWIFLLQAEKGKEKNGEKGVKSPINFQDYSSYLPQYKLVLKEDAYEAHRRVRQSGGYFQAIWEYNKYLK